MGWLLILGVGVQELNRFLNAAALVGTAVAEHDCLAVQSRNLIQNLDADVAVATVTDRPACGEVAEEDCSRGCRGGDVDGHLGRELHRVTVKEEVLANIVM